MRCRLLLPMVAVFVRRSVSLYVSLSVELLNSAACRVCVGSFGAAVAKLLWPLVGFVPLWNVLSECGNW